MKRLYALILLLFSLILPFDGEDGSFLRAQGNDPVLAGMIFQYTDKAKKELKQQEQMMQLVSTGHISANRNKLYRELVMSSVEIVNDVRQVCLSNNKMTEKQRLEIVFGIRPKLKLMNQKLKRLIRAVKYTRLSDVWAEIDYGTRSEVDKPTIVQRCKERWLRNARP